MNETGISTQQITGSSGLSWATLHSYVQWKWIEPPRLEHYGPGNGRGSRLLWDVDVVVNRVKQIQSYKKVGLTLKQIDAILKEKSTNDFLRDEPSTDY